MKEQERFENATYIRMGCNLALLGEKQSCCFGLTLLLCVCVIDYNDFKYDKREIRILSRGRLGGGGYVRERSKKQHV